MKRFVKWLIPVFVLAVIMLLFRFVLFIGYVPTESMAPTIPRGSYIVGCRIFGKLKVGDIIVFEHEGKPLVKRIAAISGDVVEHKGRRLTVPDGGFYVLGDNRIDSFDSRIWEEPYVEECDIIGILTGRGCAQGKCDGYLLRF